mmetsp:Transcript_16318/g.38880  ORF Transcript_16318/g.38880 Transcript_16318/m.38880 type:complete len:345 (-) Transcript_16318:1616-2650(-)
MPHPSRPSPPLRLQSWILLQPAHRLSQVMIQVCPHPPLCARHALRPPCHVVPCRPSVDFCPHCALAALGHLFARHHVGRRACALPHARASDPTLGPGGGGRRPETSPKSFVGRRHVACPSVGDRPLAPPSETLPWPFRSYPPCRFCPLCRPCLPCPPSRPCPCPFWCRPCRSCLLDPLCYRPCPTCLPWPFLPCPISLPCPPCCLLADLCRRVSRRVVLCHHPDLASSHHVSPPRAWIAAPHPLGAACLCHLELSRPDPDPLCPGRVRPCPVRPCLVRLYPSHGPCPSNGLSPVTVGPVGPARHPAGGVDCFSPKSRWGLETDCSDPRASAVPDVALQGTPRRS